MRYVKDEKLLPNNLIKEIQKYIQGEYIYIPSDPEKRKAWGEKSGNREYIRSRNKDIRNMYESGWTITNLAEEYFLSTDSIKKIIYMKK